MMFYELVGEGGRNSLLMLLYEPPASLVSKACPFKTRARFWKEELYFETPVSIDESHRLSSTTRQEYGRLYYWRPGRALCVFYGVSEPYSRVLEVGLLIGSPHTSLYFNEGEELTLREYKGPAGGKAQEVVRVYKELGYYSGVQVEDGELVVVAAKIGGGGYLSLKTYVEEPSVYVESNPLLRYDGSTESERLVKKLKWRLRGRLEYSRIDISEDDYLVLSGSARGEEELIRVVGEMEESYALLKRAIVEI